MLRLSCGGVRIRQKVMIILVISLITEGGNDGVGASIDKNLSIHLT